MNNDRLGSLGALFSERKGEEWRISSGSRGYLGMCLRMLAREIFSRVVSKSSLCLFSFVAEWKGRFWGVKKIIMTIRVDRMG